MSQQVEGIHEAIITWAVFASESNTTITAYNPATKARGSLLGFLSTEDLTKTYDAHLVGLQKQITGSNSSIAMSSSGSSFISSFNLQGVDKYTAKILTNEVGDFTAVVPDDAAVGSIKGESRAGFGATPHRFVFIPQLQLPNGDFEGIIDMDLTYAFEVPEGIVTSAYEVGYSSEDYASIDVELEALSSLPGGHDLFIEGPAIELTIT